MDGARVGLGELLGEVAVLLGDPTSHPAGGLPALFVHTLDTSEPGRGFVLPKNEKGNTRVTRS